VTWEPDSATRWGVEAYSKRWTTISPYLDSQLDPLSLTPDLQPDRIRVVPEESEASGLELSGRREFSDRLSPWATLRWARVADDSPAGDVLRSWDQSLALTLGASWQAARWNASVFGGWHRGWPRTPLTLEPLTLGERNSDRWRDFFTLDVRGS